MHWAYIRHRRCCWTLVELKRARAFWRNGEKVPSHRISHTIIVLTLRLHLQRINNKCTAFAPITHWHHFSNRNEKKTGKVNGRFSNLCVVTIVGGFFSTLWISLTTKLFAIKRSLSYASTQRAIFFYQPMLYIKLDNGRIYNGFLSSLGVETTMVSQTNCTEEHVEPKNSDKNQPRTNERPTDSD